MRKNLHYKVLASVLAIAGLYFYNAPAAWADIIYDAYQVKGDGTETITINNNYVDGIIGQLGNTFNIYGNYQDSGDANGNGTTTNVNITNNSNLSSIYGGFSGSDNANKNIVHIDKSTAINVFGGYANSNSNSGNANKNKVTIKNNSTINDVYGGYSISGSANNNTVIIEDSTVTNHYFPKTNAVITGGYAVNHKNLTTVSATNNTVKLIGSTNVENADIYGGRTDKGNIDVTTGNKLILENWRGSVKSVQNFSDIDFKEIDWNNGGPVLNITESPEKALANTTLNLISFAGGTTINKDESMTFVASKNGTNLGITVANLKVDSDFFAGVTVKGDGNFTVDANGNVIYTVQEVKTNKQIDLVAENRAVAAAFVNQGTDLISDSLDTLSRDDSYGVKTFAAVHGNRSKYDVNSDLKINGWSTIVGVGNAAEFADGDEFSWGVFYENGSGNYRTYNEFNNEFFRGDGSLVYNGGGIAARYENNSGVYTEGSLRAGMLKSEMDNALRDGSSNYYGYDSESAYYGAHIGVGKIISLSDSSDLDVYGKFFHTYTEGDSFTVDKDKFEFDSITSDRLRIGARVTTNKANAFSTYYGLAYEYEFNGDADMRAQNLKAPTQSLQGSSYMAEVGFNYQPTPDSPWSFDLNMRGYAGEREGASFNVQATYTF